MRPLRGGKRIHWLDGLAATHAVHSGAASKHHIAKEHDLDVEELCDYGCDGTIEHHHEQADVALDAMFEQLRRYGSPARYRRAVVAFVEARNHDRAELQQHVDVAAFKVSIVGSSQRVELAMAAAKQRIGCYDRAIERGRRILARLEGR